MTSGLQKLALTLAALFSVSGCNKAASSDPTAAASASAGASASCAPGAFNHSGPDFCISLPSGYRAGSVQARRLAQQLPFDGPNDARFMLAWVPVAQYDSELAAVKEAAVREATSGTGERGDLPGGGYWYHVKHENGIHQAEILVKGKSEVFRCHVNTLSERIDAELAACKSLRAQ